MRASYCKQFIAKFSLVFFVVHGCFPVFIFANASEKLPPPFPVKGEIAAPKIHKNALNFKDVQRTPENAQASILLDQNESRPVSVQKLHKQVKNVVSDTKTLLKDLAPIYRLKKGVTPDISIKKDLTNKATKERHVRMNQSYQGLPVIGEELIVHVNKDGVLHQIDGNYAGNISVNTNPDISSKKALDVWTSTFSDVIIQNITTPALVIDSTEGNYTLVWKYMISGKKQNGTPVKMQVFVNAKTGKILRSYNNVQYAAPQDIGSGNRLFGEGGGTVNFPVFSSGGEYLMEDTTTRRYTIFNASTDTGTYLDANTIGKRQTTDWGSSDPVEVSAVNNIISTLDYLSGATGFSVNDIFSGGTLKISVHSPDPDYGWAMVNAYWDGSGISIGDGNGAEYGPLATLDVIAHEFGHAWTERTSNLVYQNEPGALNESFSDILGTVVELASEPDGTAQYPNIEHGSSDWIIGEDITLSGSVGIRDMRDPKSLWQPSRYKGQKWDFDPFNADNGGVHGNSSIQNYFFYLLSEGGVGNNEGITYSFSGVGVQNAGKIALETNMYHVASNDTYETVRQKWIDAANALDVTGAWAEVVKKSWNAVGVFPMPTYPVSIDESFESLTPGSLPSGWSTSLNNSWVVDSSTGAADGTYSAHSVNTINDSTGSIDWSGSIEANGFVTFFVKTSSELNFDKLNFYVDGVKAASYSGENEWAFKSYYVTSGPHTLRWEYSKDVVASVGNDRVWIDGITFPHYPYINNSYTFSGSRAYTNSGMFITATGGIMELNADNLTSQIEYTISGDIDSTKTGTLIISSPASINMTFAPGDGVKYIDTAYEDIFGNVTSLRDSIFIDRTAPISSVTAPSQGFVDFSGTQGFFTTGSFVTVNGVSQDAGIGGIQVYVTDNDTTLSGSASMSGSMLNSDWNTTVSLNGGIKYYTISSSDSLGNTSTSSLAISRIPVISHPQVQFIASAPVSISFETDISSTGFVNVGTDPNDLSTHISESSSGTTTHTVSVSLLPDTTYYYQLDAAADIYSYASALGVLPILSFRTPAVIDKDGGTISGTYTGSVLFSGVGDLVVFTATGNISVVSNDGQNSVSFPVDNLSIAGNSWDHLFNAPDITSWSGSVPVADGYSLVGNIFSIGGSQGALTLSGQAAQVSIGGFAPEMEWQTLQILSSVDSGSSFAATSSCVVINRTCGLQTTQLGLLAFSIPSDATPNAFAFTGKTNAEFNTQVVSDSIVISGINKVTSVSTSSGTLYSINGATFTGMTGSIQNGDNIRVSVLSLSGYSLANTGSITIGWINASFIVTTKSAPVVPPSTGTVSSAPSSGGGGGGTYGGGIAISYSGGSGNGASSSTSSSSQGTSSSSQNQTTSSPESKKVAETSVNHVRTPNTSRVSRTSAGIQKWIKSPTAIFSHPVGMEEEVLIEIEKNQKVTIFSTENGWSLVRFKWNKMNYIGYVKSKDVE